MNSKGNVIIFILIAFAAVLLLPPLIITVFPAAKYLFALIMVFIIWSTVRGYLGDGILTYLFTGILIYFLVIKWLTVTSSLFVFQILLGVGFGSVIMWGVGTRFR
ncbi:MAG: hypothetical protein Q7R70_06585 [Candidatus Diapherotrites archaeon]|nr:hypothetical protein [Candidatus Diapherotrites archaeon]